MQAPPPPPGLGKPVAFTDTECFPNFWLLKFRVENGPLYSFSLRSGESFTEEKRAEINYLLSLFTLITFNGNYYDVPMIGAAIEGYDCEALHWLNFQIIGLNQKPWDLPIAWRPVDHIDVIEVLPGAGSQKQYAGRIHSKTIQDLPYPPDTHLTEEQIQHVDSYCGIDLNVLADIYYALKPQRTVRELLTVRYGIDLRSKSDAQLAEAVIKHRCEQAVGYRLYKQDIDWNLRFYYNPPAHLAFTHPEMQRAFEIVKSSLFHLAPNGSIEMPPELADLTIKIGLTEYKMGIGGLHSKDVRAAFLSSETHQIRDYDVASYYPRLILLSGEYPEALGPVFREIYQLLIDERLMSKKKEKALDKLSAEFELVHCENEGGKVMINGTFGKTGSVFSILYAPKMLIQTTVTGQLDLLMLIEKFENYRIQVISANTDGVVIKCARHDLGLAEQIVKQWMKLTGLDMESTDYAAIYVRDVNAYFAIKTSGEVKRKGEYSKAGLIEKKNPDVEICSDAIEAFLAKGTPILQTLAECRDIRKFVTVCKVSGGGVKLWGHGPIKGTLVRDMVPTLLANGWVKSGRKWTKADQLTDPTTAYNSCFEPQRPEYLGKVVRWYYGRNSPGPIIYNTNGNQVSLSNGAQPCMTLPDEFPTNIDYIWYARRCEDILEDVGYWLAHCPRCHSLTDGGSCQNYGCEGER